MEECKNCCYYAESEETPYEHCCFIEWGHQEWEIAPCDEEEINPDYREYQTGGGNATSLFWTCGGRSAPHVFCVNRQINQNFARKFVYFVYCIYPIMSV